MSASTSPDQPLAPPSTDILEKLLDLAKKGDLDSILEEADRLSVRAELGPFADRLAQFAENFQIKQLREFLDQYV